MTNLTLILSQKHPGTRNHPLMPNKKSAPVYLQKTIWYCTGVSRKDVTSNHQRIAIPPHLRRSSLTGWPREVACKWILKMAIYFFHPGVTYFPEASWIAYLPWKSCKLQAISFLVSVFQDLLLSVKAKLMVCAVWLGSAHIPNQQLPCRELAAIAAVLRASSQVASTNISPMLHVWNICLPLAWIYDACR